MIASRKILEIKLTEYFKRRDIQNFYFLDKELFKKSFPSDERIELVLLGEAPYFFSHGRIAAFKNPSHYWVLCQSLKKLLVNYMHLPEESVSVIDRYELFPDKTPEYSIEDSKSFVFAGRDIVGKNIPELIKLLNTLQRNEFPEHDIYFIGKDFIDMHPDVEKFVWTKEPKFLGERGYDWIYAPMSRPVFINVSDYHFEDFSVASAEAQSAGMPIISSDWYGMKDLRGDEVIFLTPLSLIENTEIATNLWLDEIRRNLKKRKNEKNHSKSNSSRMYLGRNELLEIAKAMKSPTHKAINDFFGLSPERVTRQECSIVWSYLSHNSLSSLDAAEDPECLLLLDCILKLSLGTTVWTDKNRHRTFISKGLKSHEKIEIDGFVASIVRTISDYHDTRTVREMIRNRLPDVMWDKNVLSEVERALKELINHNIIEYEQVSLSCIGQ